MSCISTPIKRIQDANALIRVIGSHGRRLFFCSTTGRLARLELDTHNRVWLIDGYTGLQVYTHGKGKWEGFSSGDLMRRLVERIRDYIIRGEVIPRECIVPACEDGGEIDLWEYGEEACELVRAAAFELPIIAQEDQLQ